MDYDPLESKQAEQNRKVTEKLSNETWGMSELNTISAYLSKITRFPDVSAIEAHFSQFSFFTQCMSPRKRKLYKLVDSGSERIDMNLDIQTIIKNNLMFTNLMRLKINPQELALFKLQKMGVLADDSCEEGEYEANEDYDDLVL
jgi:hypothetical protein